MEEESVSESETSADEGFNDCIEIAFQSVKKYLNQNGVKQIESRKNEELIHATHKKIYDSFDTDSEDEVEEPVKIQKDNKEESAQFKLQSTTLFTIDKQGSNKSHFDTEVLQTEVFNIDLTELNESEPQKDGGTVDEDKEDEDKETDDEEKTEDTEQKLSKKKIKNKNRLSSVLNAGLNTKDLYVDDDPLNVRKQKKKKKEEVQKEKRMVEPEIMKKCVLTEDYEKQVTIPTPRSKRTEKKERRAEREKTKGTKWFNLPAQEVTEERKNDFLVYQMRKSLDPKRFYKTNDAVGIPKYYQFGTVVEHSSDFYDSRIPKKQRKANMVEELLADAKFRQYNKRRYAAIQEAKRLGTGPYDDMKKLKRRKKAK